MIAGRMRHRLTLLQPETVTNDYGEEAQTYTEVCTVWAERVTFSGRNSEEVGEHFPAYSAKFNIRSGSGVSEHWRAQLLGGDLYCVQAIVPYDHAGFDQLICEKVNG